MIFVTTGTHEQQFNRLVKEVDKLIEQGFIKDEVFIQYGYSTYKPKHCIGDSLIGYDQMIEKIEQASIVITHGGPGSIMLPLSLGKLPIVVPRQVEFGEHVDNHQVDFVRRLEKENKVIAVYDINELKNKILNYNNLVRDKIIGHHQGTTEFVKKFEKMITQLFRSY